VERTSAEGVDLPLESRREEPLLTGEAPVDGRPRATGFSGDVVERGLAESDPGDARERPVDDSVLLRE